MQERSKTCIRTQEPPERSKRTKIDVRLQLSALWIALMLLYIYADIFSFFRPGVIEDMMAGRIGPFPVTQASLLTAAGTHDHPGRAWSSCALSLKHRAARWTNIILGVLYTLVNVSILIGEHLGFLYSLWEFGTGSDVADRREGLEVAQPGRPVLIVVLSTQHRKDIGNGPEFILTSPANRYRGSVHPVPADLHLCFFRSPRVIETTTAPARSDHSAGAAEQIAAFGAQPGAAEHRAPDRDGHSLHDRYWVREALPGLD